MAEYRHIGKVRRRQDGRAIVTGRAESRPAVRFSTTICAAWETE